MGGKEPHQPTGYQARVLEPIGELVCAAVDLISMTAFQRILTYEGKSSALLLVY